MDSRIAKRKIRRETSSVPLRRSSATWACNAHKLWHGGPKARGLARSGVSGRPNSRLQSDRTDDRG
jgi:hypothetical protein